jgi:hypothetical protein
MDFADWFWLIVVGVIAVGDIVMAVFFKKKRWTLSHHVWEWFAIGKPWGEHLAWLRWIILAGEMISITLHFVAGLSVVWIIVFGIGCAWSMWYYYVREAKA